MTGEKTCLVRGGRVWPDKRAATMQGMGAEIGTNQDESDRAATSSPTESVGVVIMIPWLTAVIPLVHDWARTIP